MGALRRAAASDVVRFVALTIYYVAIIAGLIGIYAGRHAPVPRFIYQEF